jgi:hypothetical protein
MTLAAYWEDLLDEGGTQQGVYYQVDSISPQPSVTFEYLLASLGVQNQYYHFLVNYQSSNPGVIKVYYFVTGDSGSGRQLLFKEPMPAVSLLLPTPAIWTEHDNANRWHFRAAAIPYANNGSPAIAPGQVVTFDTNQGTGSVGTFNNACYTPIPGPRPPVNEHQVKFVSSARLTIHSFL